MEKLDINGDNKISKTEWKWATDSFETMDMDHDGFITPKELEMNQKEWERTYQSRHPKNK